MALGGCLAWLSLPDLSECFPTFSRPVFLGWFRFCFLGGFGGVLPCLAVALSVRSWGLGVCAFGVLPLFVPASLTSYGLHSLAILLTPAGLTLLSFRGVPASPRASACLSSCLSPWLASDPSRPSKSPPASHLTRGVVRASPRLFGSSCVPRQSGGNCQILNLTYSNIYIGNLSITF